MPETSLTLFDIAVLVIVGLSTLLAFGRGFATVALSLAAWVGALMATVFGGGLLEPHAREMIKPEWLADTITYAVLFILSLYVLKKLAEMLGRSIKDSPVGFLDRSLGALFGLLRGMVIVSALYFGFTKFMPMDKEPEWMKEAQLRPLVAWGAEMLEGFAAEALGKDPTEIGDEYMKKAADSVPSQFINEKLEEQAAKYMEAQRDKLDELVEEVVNEKNR